MQIREIQISKKIQRRNTNLVCLCPDNLFLLLLSFFRFCMLHFKLIFLLFSIFNRMQRAAVIFFWPCLEFCINQHHLHWLQTWPPDGTTCIGSKFDHQMTIYKFNHQMAPLALLINLHTRLSHMHYLIALDCPIGIISQY